MNVAYMFGALFGLAWLYFWIRGVWFAAVVAALILGTAWFILPSPGMSPVWWMGPVCFVGPWVPMLVRMAISHAAKRQQPLSLFLTKN